LPGDGNEDAVEPTGSTRDRATPDSERVQEGPADVLGNGSRPNPDGGLSPAASDADAGADAGADAAAN
jgi:hypothetical protein